MFWSGLYELVVQKNPPLDLFREKTMISMRSKRVQRTLIIFLDYIILQLNEFFYFSESRNSSEIIKRLEKI